METFQLIEPYISVRFVPSVIEFETKPAVPKQIVHPAYGFIYGHPAVRELLARFRTIKFMSLPQRLCFTFKTEAGTKVAYCLRWFWKRILKWQEGYTVIA